MINMIEEILKEKLLQESIIKLGRDKLFTAIANIQKALNDKKVITSDVYKTLINIKNGEKLSDEQKTKLGDDIKNLLTSLGYGVVFMLPGGSVFIITYKLLKKYMNTKKINESNKLEGGKGDNMTPKKIADKFDVKVKDVKKQIDYGTCVECEHTDDKEKAKEIATDHVAEFPDYYNRIYKMEKQAEKHWGKKENTNESKTLIKKLLRENLSSNQAIQQQIQSELERLGLDANTQVYISGEPISCSRETSDNINEGFKNIMAKAFVVCSIAAGAVSCKKADTEIMYKYVYDDAGSLEYSKEKGYSIRNTCLVPYDHVLSPDEIRAEQDKIANDYATNSYKKTKVMNDTLVPMNTPTPKTPTINNNN